MAGLEDEERPGRPRVYNRDDVLLLVKTVTEPSPEGATRWTMEALVQAMAGHGVPISASEAWRICRALDLKPWQVESWMTSHDPATHASWLNQIELFFSILERRLMCRGEFDSVDHLAERLVAFIKDYNRRAAPFRWTCDGRPLMAA